MPRLRLARRATVKMSAELGPAVVRVDPAPAAVDEPEHGGPGVARLGCWRLAHATALTAAAEGLSRNHREFQHARTDVSRRRSSGAILCGMPHRNRVTPFGEIVAIPERGTLMGNRGVIHADDGSHRREWQVRRWIACRLEFKGRRRAVRQPRPLDRAVLPRRGDRARRRPPPVRRVPARGLPALAGGLAGRRRARRRDGPRPARRPARRQGQAHLRGAARRAARRRDRGARRRGVPGGRRARCGAWSAAGYGRRGAGRSGRACDACSHRAPRSPRSPAATRSRCTRPFPDLSIPSARPIPCVVGGHR